MSLLCAWQPADPERPAGPVVEAMGRALRTHAGERWASWELPGLAVGLLETPTEGDDRQPLARRLRPAVLGERHYLWMAGEVFAAPGELQPGDPEESRTHPYRLRLLRALVEKGARRVVPSLDGEYQILLWDSREGALEVLCDRFASLPSYYGESTDGFAFAGGVRGVLAAPGIPLDPDREALREAVTFGGFRLGTRTNVAAVRMLPGASRAVAAGGRLRGITRLWRWPGSIDPATTSSPELATEQGFGDDGDREAPWIEEARARWQTAVARRLAGAERPGQTLSGGLDSRAILAEAACREPGWTAVTYGVPGCDDARYAERAARAAGVSWVFVPLYSGHGHETGWLEERTRHVQATDGLIELVDLMHLESLREQAERIDVNLSGYIGDAVAGATFTEVTDAEGVMYKLPYYGGRLGLPWEETLARVQGLVASLHGASPRYALFEAKIPQATNKVVAAARPYMTLRRPFTDYELFDFFQSLPLRTRREDRLYERFLVAAYPKLFGGIPNQRTGLPVLAPPWRLQLERAKRFAQRKAEGLLGALGLPTRPRRRLYSADEDHWRRPGTREAIRETVLRPGSIACDVFGRGEVEAVLTAWEERAAAPAQVIGALYVCETYHRDLAGFLRERRAGQGAPA